MLRSCRWHHHSLALALLSGACLLAAGSSAAAKVLVKDIAVAAFKDIAVTGSFDVDITQGMEQVVRITAEEEAFEALKAQVKGDTLLLEAQSPSFWDSCPNDCKFKAEITTPTLQRLVLSGSSNLTAQNLALNSLTLDVSGTVDAKLLGTSQSLVIDASGAAKVDASELKADHVTIAASGSVDGDVFAAKSLKVDISGNGKVRYSGSPSEVKTEIAGSGQVAPQHSRF